MVSVLYRESESLQVVDVVFSVSGCAAWLQLTPRELVADPDDEDDATNVDVFTTGGVLNLTVVTFFNSEGESKSFTGPSDQFMS